MFQAHMKQQAKYIEYIYILLENQGLVCHWNGANSVIKRTGAFCDKKSRSG
jgi:hypothetical protein